LKNPNKMASVNEHRFYCVELSCSAEAYVSGGRCDDCFEAHISKLREAHNPPHDQHTCSGEFDYDLGCYVCDDNDNLYCPSYRPKEPEARSCADCGYKPEDGHFPCYRGNDPLCADCEEAAYGPPSPEDWREQAGHCTKCNSNFLIICSSDDRTCCRLCRATGALPPSEEMDEECIGCAGPSRPGANGYCSACWHQRYGCDDE